MPADDAHSTHLAAEMLAMGGRARTASDALTKQTAETRTAALNAMADQIRAAAAPILAANEEDTAAATAKGLSGPMLDRLKLTPERLEGVAAGVEAVAAMTDPVGRTLAEWERPNGLKIARVTQALGVIGIIYESRPNVTADAGVLCVRSGNAAILRGGSESARTSRALAEALRAGLADAGAPEDAIQLIQTTDRAAVGHLLTGLDGCVDVIVPRGGKSLVERVSQEARVPVIGHLEGLCHAYVHSGADPEKAASIVANAKLRRTGICGALETLLIDKAVAGTLLPQIKAALDEMGGCELRGDAAARAILPMTAATEGDYRTEHLAAILNVRVVDGLEKALEHIETYGTDHTEVIITEDAGIAERFLNETGSAIVLWNASTQFADGGEFGMGAEIGIATGRIHARGPVGADQLVTFRYQVRGTGQIRP